MAMPHKYLMEKLRVYLCRGISKWYGQIALALAAGDNEQLALAIDQADEHGLIVHAARMRIVLAQRTRDQQQLESARPLLEQLGDRRALCKLEEVREALAKSQASHF
jgi:hypothetical protein